MDNVQIKHNPEQERFETTLFGNLAVLEYQVEADRIIFTHTGVPIAIDGKGIGSALVKAGLEYARARRLKVVPACPFIQSYLIRHPEYSDLV